MAGLGTPQQQPQSQAGAPMQGGDEGYESATKMLGDMDESALEQASPEEQAQYEAFVEMMQNMIYPEATPGEINPAILANLKGQFDPAALEMFQQAEPALTDSPQDSAAATAVLLTLMAEGQGKFSDEIVMHGGAAAIEELVEVAEAAKIHDFAERDMETITYRAMDLYRTASPRVDPAALTEQFKALMVANDQGNLGAVLPGLPGGAPMQQKEA